MNTEKYGVISLVLEFFLSLIVLLGSGFLIYKGIAVELAASAISLVLAFWFQRRQTEQLLRKRPNDPQPPATPEPTPKDDAPRLP